MNDLYKKQVALLIRIIPSVYRIQDFAVRGGTAINLFHKDMYLQMFTKEDKDFFVSFEQGEPEWSKCCAGDLSEYPSVKWKHQNILKLKETNPEKYCTGLEKLRECLF